MKKNWLFKYALSICIIAMLTGGVALAQSGYVLHQGTVDGGGGTSSSSGNSFTLSGTIGQPDAGSMSGGSGSTTFKLGSGFWGGGTTTTSTSTYKVYLPITIKN